MQGRPCVLALGSLPYTNHGGGKPGRRMGDEGMCALISRVSLAT